MKTIIIQKNVYMSTKECQNHSVLMAKFYGKYIRLGGYTIINFAIKREKLKKRWIYYMIFVENLQHY